MLSYSRKVRVIKIEWQTHHISLLTIALCSSLPTVPWSSFKTLLCFEQDFGCSVLLIQGVFHKHGWHPREVETLQLPLSWLVWKSAPGEGLAGLFSSSVLVSSLLGPSLLQTWSSPIDTHLKFLGKVLNTHWALNSRLLWKKKQKQNKRTDFSMSTVSHRKVFISFKLVQAMLTYVVGFCAGFHCEHDAKEKSSCLSLSPPLPWFEVQKPILWVNWALAESETILFF